MLKALSSIALACSLLPALTTPARADADADFTKGDWSAAQSGWSIALQADPKNAAALLGLARLALYADRRTEAERLADSIPPSDPLAPKAAALITEAKRREADLDPANLSVPSEGTRVPFALTDPLPVLKVRVNDKADAFFLLDTGASEAVLDPEFATELGIASSAAGNGIFAGGKTAAVRTATLDSLALGAARITHLPVKVVPTRGFKLDADHRLDGIIGTGVLYRFLSTIDYPKGELILRPRDASADFERKALAEKAIVAPLWLVGDHFLFTRARLNDGPERYFNVDTGGAGVGVMASPATIADSHVTLDTAHAGEGQGGGGMVKLVPFSAAITLQGVEQTGVPGMYTPEGNQYGIFPFETGGSLSHLYFHTHALTFDFVAMKLVLEKP
jgi:hypothetical protein